MNFQISTFLGSAPSPMCLQSVVMESKRRLEVPERSVQWFLRLHQGSYISIFKSLPSWEVLHLLCVSRASSWSLRGRLRFLNESWWFLRWWMPQGYIQEATYQFSRFYPPGKCSFYEKRLLGDTQTEGNRILIVDASFLNVFYLVLTFFQSYDKP